MTNNRKQEIENNAVAAFENAESNGFVSSGMSASALEDVAYEVLEMMPGINVANLTDDEYDYAVSTLKTQLF